MTDKKSMMERFGVFLRKVEDRLGKWVFYVLEPVDKKFGITGIILTILLGALAAVTLMLLVFIHVHDALVVGLLILSSVIYVLASHAYDEAA